MGIYRDLEEELPYIAFQYLVLRGRVFLEGELITPL
jgi:hypothetical protein